MRRPLVVWLVVILTTTVTRGQGTLIFDQQSAGEGALGVEAGVQADAPLFSPPRIGQSFTPAFSSVGFIRLALGPDNGDSATSFILHLRVGSINGAIIASTDPITLRSGSFGPANLLFASPVPVTPGETYFFDLEIPQWHIGPGDNPKGASP